MGKFNSAKQFIGQIFGGKVSPTITKVKPNVGSPSKSALNKQIQKTKASGAKLKQTLFESKNKAFRGDDFTFSYSKKKTPKVSEQKAKGGRVGLKRGTGVIPKKKSNVQKIKETFGPKKKKFTDTKETSKPKITITINSSKSVKPFFNNFFIYWILNYSFAIKATL